ncbi:hypothetical protein EHS15_04255 [Leptospira idonii]|uniref:Uncharacterized protein n=2 Tax=Leptospira idonii TaxID=1193500 RepID=A0A4V3JYB4_9LEPT|nr:hypothetical protein EHS15_04255 [Leptospira idonii]
MIWSILSPGLLMSQTKEGFYDTNNYDLRKLPGSDPEANIMPDVSQPPTFQKPVLSTPKDARTQYDPIASIPGAGAMNPSQMNTGNIQTNASQNPLSKSGTLPINPLTGEVNPAALQGQLDRSRIKKEIEKKKKEEFDEDAVYEETKFRRGYIIFFLTVPFALGLSAGLAGAIGATKTLGGSLIMISGTFGLSGTNVYLDNERIEEHREKKKQKQLADKAP